MEKPRPDFPLWSKQQLQDVFRRSGLVGRPLPRAQAPDEVQDGAKLFFATQGFQFQPFLGQSCRASTWFHKVNQVLDMRGKLESSKLTWFLDVSSRMWEDILQDSTSLSSLGTIPDVLIFFYLLPPF